MIRCMKCDTDKDYNDYHVLGHSVAPTCIMCLDKIIEERKDD